MDLKQENKEYSKDKEVQETLKKLNSKISQLEIDQTLQTREVEDSAIELKRKREDNAPKNIIEGYENKLRIEKERLEKINNQLKKIKDVIQKNLDKVDRYFEKISENPELKSELDKAMSKKLARKLTKINSEKAKMELFKELIENHPSLQSQFTGMKNAKDELDKLQKEKENLDEVKDADRIKEISEVLMPKLTGKLEKNKEPVLNLCKKEGIDISENDIKELLNGNFKRNKEGEINFKKAFDNKVKGYNKQIATYETALEKVQPIKKKEDREANDGANNDNKEEVTETALDTQPKWYQLIKRFRNYRNNLKQPEVKETETETETEKEDKKGNFKDAYKYEIIQQYQEKYEQNLLKEAKQENKQKNQTDDAR